MCGAGGERYAKTSPYHSPFDLELLHHFRVHLNTIGQGS